MYMDGLCSLAGLDPVNGSALSVLQFLDMHIYS